MLEFERFKEQFMNVVNWNAVARNGVHDYGQDALNRQTEYTRSEIQETLVGIINDDHQEVLDGAADIFVTLAYKLFLQAQGDVDWEEVADTLFTIDQQRRGLVETTNAYFNKQNLLDLTVSVRIANDFEEASDLALGLLVELMMEIESQYGIDSLELTKHIMDSNWSKFPPAQDLNVTDQEVQYITEKMGGKFVDIVGTLNEDFNVIVYRSDKGIGKIMKPSTFWEPDTKQFLSAA